MTFDKLLYTESMCEGEMHYVPSGPNSYFQLPRAGGIAYAAQESWVQNETIRVSLESLRVTPSHTHVVYV